MSDVVVSIVESVTNVTVTETSVNLNVVETPVTVVTGTSGPQGPQGTGYSGVTSTSTITIGSGLKTFTLVGSNAGAFITGMRVRAIHSDTPTYYLEGTANYVGGGTLIITVDKFNGSGSHNSWFFAVSGEVGQTGAKGDTGAQGPSGVVAVTSPITNTGTSTSAQLGLDQTAITITPSQVTGTAVITTDSRLSNARTPTAHASSHASAGSDPITIAESQVTGLTTDLAAKANLAGGNAFTEAQTVTGSVAAAKVLVVKGAASQSANLQEWQNSSGSVLSSVASNGAIYASGLFTSQYIQDTAQATPYLDFSSNKLTANARVATYVPFTVKGAASQVANLIEWQDSTGTVLSLINATGTFRGTNLTDINGTGAYLSLQPGVAGAQILTRAAANKGLIIQGAASQSADLQQYLTSAGTVIGGRNANAQIYTGTTTPLTSPVGGGIQSIATGANPLVTMASAHNLSVGDLVVLAGTTGGTYNGTFVIATTPASTTFTITSALTAGQAAAGGTVSAPAQTSITARSLGTTPLYVNAGTGQTAVLTKWAINQSTVAQVSSAGNMQASGLGTLTSQVFITDFNSGGQIRMTKQTAVANNPGAGLATLYFRDGTTGGTLKLVVRAGAAGAETTILDNIPQ